MSLAVCDVADCNWKSIEDRRASYCEGVASDGLDGCRRLLGHIGDLTESTPPLVPLTFDGGRCEIWDVIFEYPPSVYCRITVPSSLQGVQLGFLQQLPVTKVLQASNFPDEGVLKILVLI